MNQQTTTSWDKIRAEFQKIWGYEDFRTPQAEIIGCLLGQKDALILMPTGGGKSICFQLPALLQTGLTIVVSPLVALMENQVQELRQRNLPAALLHSELPSYQRRLTLQALEKQELRLLYVSPETLLSPPVWERLCQPDLKINGLILDEAHCLVQWGETFRPAYRRLGAVRPALLKSKPPGTKISLAAFTATADPLAQKTIESVLQLQHPEVFRLSPYRQNLHPSVCVVWTPRGRKQKLLEFIKNKNKNKPEQPGLVYVRTRRDSESLAVWLQEKGYSTASYHAGLDAQERRAVENSWLRGEVPFVITTNAFGMGINKPDVRWVIHFHPPFLLSEYVQEIGRAGRDGKPAEVLMLVSEPTGWLYPEDKHRQRYFEDTMHEQQQTAQKLIKKLPSQGEINAVTQQFKDSAVALSLLHANGQLNWLDPFNYTITTGIKKQSTNQLVGVKQMSKYVATKQCRWQFMLNAFGFDEKGSNWRCGHCNNCR